MCGWIIILRMSMTECWYVVLGPIVNVWLKFNSECRWLQNVDIMWSWVRKLMCGWNLIQWMSMTECWYYVVLGPKAVNVWLEFKSMNFYDWIWYVILGPKYLFYECIWLNADMWSWVRELMCGWNLTLGPRTTYQHSVISIRRIKIQDPGPHIIFSHRHS